MLRKGQQITTLTKKTGQAVRHGIVVKVDADFIEVKWDDGHVSTVTAESIVPAKKDKVG